jgi:hypothetical protein
MGLLKKQGNSGIKCPACGSFKTAAAKGTRAFVAYPGFYSGISSNSDTGEINLWQCKECKNIFKRSLE